MTQTDRRTQERRGASRPAVPPASELKPPEDRRDRRERRRLPRRRSDMRTIAHFANGIGAGDTRLEVIVDGDDGMRLVGMFQCGCVAIEPIGEGPRFLRLEPCLPHTDPPVGRDRRRQRAP